MCGLCLEQGFVFSLVTEGFDAIEGRLGTGTSFVMIGMSLLNYSRSKLTLLWTIGCCGLGCLLLG